ncbi:MAG: hypothetical protein WAT58_04605 [Candidatus Dormiibacterota bacterium]|jgi:hypothetical protein|nr:hypothetical protein [Candidatus Dormibacteraeota bacterium]
MIRTEGTNTAELDEEVSDATASHQRLLAMLVERQEVRVDPDPSLTQDESEAFDQLESRLFRF